jgi:uncharacterized phage protein (TIGR02220 family)
MSKINNENYILIQGWMVNELNLKGNELLIYAIIYGFSQTENQLYSGSLQYLADWTNSSKQGVILNLKSLISKGLIVKNERLINGVKFCEYYSTKLNGVLKKVEWGIKESLIGGIKESLINNIDINNINNNIDNNIKENIKEIEVSHSAKAEQCDIPYEDIINYLNFKAGTNYRCNTNKTRNLIKARFNEGYTAKEFKIVIDKKCLEWLNNKDMNKYLRPETLFGTKFEGYLNQKITITTKDLAPMMNFDKFR